MPGVLFVCLGNICRSPIAEGILRREAQKAGVELTVDSAGTGSWHVGQSPDPRAVAVGKRRGCDMSMTARQFKATDFSNFDLIVAMDRENLDSLHRWDGVDPSKLHIATEFDPQQELIDVPDPYYGTTAEFEFVANMLEPICTGILQALATKPALRS